MPKKIEESTEYREAVFRRSDLGAAHFEDVNLSDARIHNTSLRGAVITETTMAGARIEADVSGVVINGFRIDELIDEALLKIHPERAALKPEDSDGFRQALAYLGELRAAAIAASGALTEEERQRRTADGQWSIVENLRHLISAEAGWARRTAFGEENPYHRMGRPPTFAESWERQMGVEFDKQFSFEEVVSALEESHAVVGKRFERLTDEELARACDPERYEGSVAGALRVYLDHEWWHHETIRTILDSYRDSADITRE